MNKYLIIKSEILKLINHFEWNEKFYSRLALCRKFGVSRATVDKAVEELIQEKRLYAIKGSGTFIADPKLAEASQTTSNQNLPMISSWGVVVPNIMDDVCPSLVRGIEDYAKKYNVNIIICNTDNEEKKEADYLKRLTAFGVTGVLIVPTIINQQMSSGYEYLKKHKIPYVFCIRSVDSHISDVPTITSNDFWGGYIATQHLIQNHYQKIAYISRFQYLTSVNRFFGYAAALQEAGREIIREHVIMDTKKINGGIEQCVEKMLSLSSPPDAFFCHNDEIAIIVCKIIKSMGKKVSDDIGVIGYDNIRNCVGQDVELTSVSHKSYEIGEKAASVLMETIQGSFLQGFNITTFQPQLVVRESCRGKK